MQEERKKGNNSYRIGLLEHKLKWTTTVRTMKGAQQMMQQQNK